jgi:ketosteroid isomerase-like protein
MSQENVETVRQIYALTEDAWARRKAGVTDWTGSPMWTLWDPDVVIEENAAFPDAAVYHGYDGLLRWWTKFFEVFDELRMEPQEFIPVGDQVVVQVHHWFRAKIGVELEQDITHVWTLRNGRVVHAVGYHERSDALDAAGLSDLDAQRRS